MAKQSGLIKITGTIGNITFYEWDGKHYARLKSSLTGKRVKKDPRFRRTMEFAGMMAQASKIASACYRTIPEEEREHSMYRALTGIAMQMLKAGKSAEEIVAEMALTKAEIRPSKTEKIPISRPRMLVDDTGKLVFTTLSCSKPNTVRLKTGQPRRRQPLIINTIPAGIPFVPN